MIERQPAGLRYLAVKNEVTKCKLDIPKSFPLFPASPLKNKQQAYLDENCFGISTILFMV
jgi:hypothetical protein